MPSFLILSNECLRRFSKRRFPSSALDENWNHDRRNSIRITKLRLCSRPSLTRRLVSSYRHWWRYRSIFVQHTCWRHATQCLDWELFQSSVRRWRRRLLWQPFEGGISHNNRSVVFYLRLYVTISSVERVSSFNAHFVGTNKKQNV